MRPIGTTGEVAGETTIFVGVCWTVTSTLLVMELLLGSVIVAGKV